MRSVATRLGCHPRPLYSRVINKDALVDAIADHLLADLAPPHAEGEPWSDAARWAKAPRNRRSAHGARQPADSWPPTVTRTSVGVTSAGGDHARKLVRQRCRRAACDVGDGRVRRDRKRRGGTAVRPLDAAHLLRRHPDGVTPAEADELFALQIWYGIDGIARDAERG